MRCGYEECTFERISSKLRQELMRQEQGLTRTAGTPFAKTTHQQLTETIIPAGSCTAGVEPGVDISQVPLSGRVKRPSRSAASVPLTP